MIEHQKNNIILKIGIIVSIISYNLWPFINEYGITIFYKGNALFIFLLALYIRQTNKKNFTTFFLFCVTLNNLLDELLFDPQKIGINEYIATVLIAILWYLKDKEDA
jgi:hypothetical protein